ncbi:hypothetical protein KS4_32220 [Poriferisphaera corsica]|uniref:Prepilin-type N-terminal cleavage/methylation domain-containing protein n=1 Tax=Poriferisphaera corsica TaxID=2528020 RepID=A0A517YY28_9BACT|nr:prepilin-type N-terminal cleavage/methylation domain-containing protein [Poriferisphaera corsica]QDU35142.1 hypothetical protein KS4_32220 [Poriferisphaera corsica]
MRRRSEYNFGRGFTLIELLVVISIIALLIGILLPALGSAKASARKIQCGSNQRQVAIAVEAYLVSNQEFYPASYVYANSPTGGSWNWGEQFGTDPANGYVHWSYSLFNGGGASEDSFTCPQMSEGGHPATNPHPDAMVADQVPGNGTGSGTIDRQARWMAFTANEALIPRNKFAGATPRNYQFVRAGMVRSASQTILMAEFSDEYSAVATGSSGGSGGLSKSHRPINPFWNPNLSSGGAVAVSASSKWWTYPKKNTFMTMQQLDGQSFLIGSSTPLNGIGRHHPGGTGEYGGTANFTYADGHVENKHVMETVENKEWGEYFYSLTGENKILTKGWNFD